MIDHEITNQCIDLMETADVVIFGTIDAEGYPETRAMANLRNKSQYAALADLFTSHNNDFLIYLTSDAHSHKLRQIAANPKASAYFCNTKEPGGLMLCGTVEVAPDPAIKQQLWQDDWKIYFPGGVNDPEYNIMKFKPDFARCWFAGMKTPAEWKFK